MRKIPQTNLILASKDTPKQIIQQDNWKPPEDCEGISFDDPSLYFTVEGGSIIIDLRGDEVEVISNE